MLRRDSAYEVSPEPSFASPCNLAGTFRVMADNQREILRDVWRAFNLQTNAAFGDVPHQAIDGGRTVGQNRAGFQRALPQTAAVLPGAGGARRGAITGRTGRGRA